MQHKEGAQYDLLVIGAGPAGLASALYAAREGMKTLVLEKDVVGGMAAITAKIDNYPGFGDGLGGLELADRLLAHAQRFGAEVRTGAEVIGIEKQADGSLLVKTSSEPVSAWSVLIATGSTYKQLGVPGEKEFLGKGVHFCATCDGPIYRGKELVVVGGGNSALQEGQFLAKFAKHITMLVRGPELGGSEILRTQIAKVPNVSIVYNTAVSAIVGDGGKVVGVDAVDATTKQTKRYATDGVFPFIGLLPNTKIVSSSVKLDERGFVMTNDDFATSVPGIFAAGDVRSGSTLQIASAVGEGVSATLKVREYLATLRG